MNPAKPTPAKAPTPPPAPVVPAKPSRKFELNSKNFRTILLAGLAFMALLFIGVLFVGLGFLSKESQHMVELKVKSETADAQLANLEQAKKQVEQYSFFKDIARTVIPNDKDQATAIIEINNIAKEVGINIQSITFPQSTLGLTTGTIGTSTQQNAATSSAAKAITQAKAVSGIPGLFSLALTITPQSDDKTPLNKRVTYDKMLEFLRRIENNRHTAQITDVNISPSNAASSGLTFTLTTNIFIKP